ncbi:hypothetical protein Ahy_B01g056459 [Arachis hypogaea]|uniref:Uncharacterized protein n=1 Tax=Arachis hypogaea TaxID=3818 RepID=A0A445AYY2_ARAHY|nr:hypothetical protein Ahy_B01g056459 [Arachis hypogaea]
MAHSSSSSSNKTQTVFQTTFEETFQFLAKSRRNQEQKIQISKIKSAEKRKKHYSRSHIPVLMKLFFVYAILDTSIKMASKNQGGKNQTKDLKCSTHLLSEKFGNMSEEKKAIVWDLSFGGLMHIPLLRVHHKLLKELANSFKLGKNTLETGYGSFRVKPSTIGVALGLNASGDLFPQKGETLKNMTDEMMAIDVGNEQDRLMFKRIFILYIQMAFLLPTTITKSPLCT